MSRPSSPSSKRSSKTTARPPFASQVPRETLEVRPSWLEPDRAGPPPLQGAAADRETLEVRPSWVEGDDEAAADGLAAERPSGTKKADKAEKAKPSEKAKLGMGTAAKEARTSSPMRRGRPSLDPSWEDPAPTSEPGRSALPPPLPTTTGAVDASQASRRAKKRS